MGLAAATLADWTCDQGFLIACLHLFWIGYINFVTLHLVFFHSSMTFLLQSRAFVLFHTISVLLKPYYITPIFPAKKRSLELLHVTKLPSLYVSMALNTSWFDSWFSSTEEWLRYEVTIVKAAYLTKLTLPTFNGYISHLWSLCSYWQNPADLKFLQGLIEGAGIYVKW